MKIYHLAFLFLLQYLFGFQQKADKPAAVNMVFRSSDGGQTWQDISEGLPENWQGNNFFANDTGLYLRAENRICYIKPNSIDPFWQEEIFSDQNSRIAPGKAGMFAYTWEGQFLQKLNGTGVWSRVYTNFEGMEIRGIFEITARTLFIGSDRGLFKSSDSGETWKEVYGRGGVMKLVESNGVLMATSRRGILRSVDGGETWDCVLSEGGVGIAIESIAGGFAAIVANTTVKARTVRTSYDGGKTWQPIDAGLPADLRTASILEVGEYFFCGHPAGIFRSSDKGKTWKLLLPAVDDKVFNLFVSGNVIYAISANGGC